MKWPAKRSIVERRHHRQRRRRHRLVGHHAFQQGDEMAGKTLDRRMVEQVDGVLEFAVQVGAITLQ
ncbi:hypothetical protein [Lysobacter sp. Root916]|uniref:hypothetical protein n=1 Tax=Lysobacter sp. Root916 TaxID=1736606 RepID=UPI00138F56D5|nr:hypothetical protein [Lysobacter sp. Root916]